MSRRGAAPLLATALVGAAAAAAAVLGSLGIPGHSPGTWASRVVAATEAAGTARVRFVVTSSASGGQHGIERSTGVIDFPADAYRLTTASNGPPVVPDVQIRIGGRTYVSALIPGGRALWSESVATGVQRAVDADGEVFGALRNASAVWQVHDLGPSSVGGGTTRYRVTVRSPTPICASDAVAPASLLVWLDGHGRLVRSQLTTRFRVQTAAGGSSSWQTSVRTVELRGFGVPVAISPPPAGHVLRPASYRSTLRSRTGCP